ncbi:uncharacterized protein LOC133328646 [Musca vetustissima]|uniref:uncharacterized protein LOC133328646 n=1 Tax=Musca vetustissima TaxID=27455 RepID=UPI002AB65BAE|nr:uncharacterized protein LOC133328646 [Musca vetustissima]
MSENLNLQTIKLEPAPSTPPDDRTAQHDIKAKLQSHVKRRLHEYGQSTGEDNSNNSQLMESHSATGASAATFGDNHKKEPQTKDGVRQKRPYHKRSDKLKDSSAAAAASTSTPPPPRKYKPKVKQPVVSDSHDDNSMPATSNMPSGAISAGDEDETAVGQDNDMRTSREKEKCPDVLAMVLSMKKRALMQDPEVQKFLMDVMNVIKS